MLFLVIALFGLGLVIFDKKMNNVNAFALGVVLLVVSVFSSFVAPMNGNRVYEFEAEYELVNLQDSDKIQNTFLAVYERNTYDYYIRIDSEFAADGEKAFKRMSVRAENVEVIETNNGKPRLVEYTSYTNISPLISFFKVNKCIQYVFYVPEGSVVQAISLDNN